MEGEITLEKYNLMSLSKDELVAMLATLMDKLTEKERLDFVSKWMGPQAALEDANESNGITFIKKVELFCQDTLDGIYFTEKDDEDYYDYDYDEYYDKLCEIDESEWGKEFKKLLKISVIYSKNKQYDVSYLALDKLLSCIHEAEVDDSILGFNAEMDYIEVDWEEVFSEYYISMKNQISDKREFAFKAVDVWMNHGFEYTESILSNIDDINNFDEAIRKNIEDNMDSWTLQYDLFLLLKKLYLRLNLRFDEIAVAKSLACHNPNFLNNVAQGYIELEMWDEAIEILRKGLREVSDQQVISQINRKLIDCFEKINMLNEGYDLVFGMLLSNYSEELYLKARNIAIKMNILEEFIENIETHLESNNWHDSTTTLLKILSFEGHTSKLIDITLKSEGYLSYDYLKYTVKSLVYRALESENDISFDLKEFLEKIENKNIPGIYNMIKIPLTFDDKEILLNSATEMLKYMVKFHINAAKRSRYATAAYYMAIIKGISIYLDKEEDFNQYYEEILMENKRRIALKDEMKSRIY